MVSISVSSFKHHLLIKEHWKSRVQAHLPEEESSVLCSMCLMSLLLDSAGCNGPELVVLLPLLPNTPHWISLNAWHAEVLPQLRWLVDAPWLKLQYKETLWFSKIPCIQQTWHLLLKVHWRYSVHVDLWSPGISSSSKVLLLGPCHPAQCLTPQTPF